MRIISGLSRGRKLFTPGSTNTIRPTTDRAKEALFSILGDRVISARVLDLYTGTGAFGLEALSRGAKQILLVDFHRKALELAGKNYNSCFQNISGIPEDAVQILRHDLRRGIDFSGSKKFTAGTFDIIFLDPPYGKGLALNSLQDLDKGTLCNEETIIVAEESSDQTLPDSFTNIFLTDRRQYGDTSFWFYQVKQ